MSTLTQIASGNSHTASAAGEKYEDQKLENNHLERLPSLAGQPVSVIPGLAGDANSGIIISAFAHYTTGQIIRKFWRLYLCGLGTALAGMYIGFTITIPGNVIANPGFIEQFGTVRDPVTGALALDSIHVSLWGGFNYVAQCVLQAASPYTADRFGLKANQWLLTLFMLLAIIVEIVAKDWKAYLAAKILSGMSCAYIGTGVIAYMAETSISQIRGTMMATFSFFFALGQLAAAVGLQVIDQTDPTNYRKAFYSEFAIFGLWLIPCILLPESPIYYCKRGMHEKAKKSLRRLIGNVEGYDIEHEYAAIRYDVEQSQAALDLMGKSSWAALFKGNNLKRVFISTIVHTFQNVVGVPLIFGYTTYFFQLAGMKDAFLASVIVQVVLLIGIVISFFGVESFGRRTLTLTGGTICMICVFIVGGLGSVAISSASSNALIAVSCIWVFSYSLSLAPIGWIFVGEVSTLALKAKTAGMAVLLQSFSGILFSYTVPIMLSPQQAGWGVRIGYFFGGLTFFYLIMVYFCMPETKGRTFAELDELFERKIPLRKFGQTKTQAQHLAEQEHSERVQA